MWPFPISFFLRPLPKGFAMASILCHCKSECASPALDKSDEGTDVGGNLPQFLIKRLCPCSFTSPDTEYFTCCFTRQHFPVYFFLSQRAPVRFQAASLTPSSQFMWHIFSPVSLQELNLFGNLDMHIPAVQWPVALLPAFCSVFIFCC